MSRLNSFKRVVWRARLTPTPSGPSSRKRRMSRSPSPFFPSSIYCVLTDSMLGNNVMYVCRLHDDVLPWLAIIPPQT